MDPSCRVDEKELVVVDLENGRPDDVVRQDSLFREVVRAEHGGHWDQEDSWRRTMMLAFQCIGILYGDIGTSPLYVYSSTFEHGIGHPDDIVGVLSLIIYSFLLFTVIKIVFIALHANDHGDGGTFALYSLISRYAKVSLIPNHQAEDDLICGYSNDGKPSATLRRAHWLKKLVETSKSAKISLFLLTILAIAMVISDAVLTPPISVLSAVGGLREKAPYLTTDQIVWITVAILVVLFAIQRYGTDKVGYSFAPIILLWLLLTGATGLYNLIKHDISVLRALNPKYIIDYFRRNKKEGWVSLGSILLCFTGSEALFANLGYFSIRSIQLSFSFGLLPSVLLTYIGQAAFLSKNPDSVANTFFAATPKICVILVMIITTVLMTLVMLLVWKINIMWIALFFVIFTSTEAVYLSSVLYKFTHGPYVPVAMSVVLMTVMIVWHYVHVKRYKYESEHTTSTDKVRQMLESSDLKTVPGVALFYTELVQGIPPIFPHLIEKIPTIHSVLVFVSIKHLPVPHVDTSERFLFRLVELKEYKVFRCVARYGYRDSLEEAKDFIIALLENLKHYIRDVNLYTLDEPHNISSHSSCNHSFSRDKPSGRYGVHAEEMLTPIESFSEITTLSNCGSIRLPQLKTSKMNMEELVKIEQEQLFIEKEMEKGVVYILGETEVVARPHSSLLKKIVVNYIYSFLRKNFVQGQKMLFIPQRQLLKVGITYEI
uniref:Potassium transporter n=1 Tax=Leersia perrieri TaxID=77586 RepID=A0A0D9VVV0_9ORYZ